VAHTPAAAGDLLFVGSCNGVFWALDKNTGRERWSYRVPQADEQVSFHGDPLVTEDLVIVANDGGIAGKLGYVYAFERDTGKVHWKHAAGQGTPAGIVGERGAVYTVTTQRELICLDRDRGAVHWTFSLEPWPWQGPAVQGRFLVAAGRDGRVHGLASEDGKVLWERTLDAPVTTSPAIARGCIYLGTDDGTLHRLDQETGAELSVLRVPGRPRGRLAVTGDRLLVMLADDQESIRTVMALDLALKAELWRQTASRHWSTSRLFLWRDCVLVADGGEVDAFVMSDGRRSWTRTFDGTVRVIGGSDHTLFAGTTDGAISAFLTPEHD
jgi:outer membrane protein assembly factor BamB